jgi:hypothetical protein
MAKKENNPPVLRGFSTGGTGKNKALSSPTTSLWLAIIFVAMFFALLSVQRNIKSAKAINTIETKFSGWIVPAPEEKVDRTPPPNPDFMFNREEAAQVVLEDSIELREDEPTIKIRPIEVKIDVKMPDYLRPNTESVD